MLYCLIKFDPEILKETDDQRECAIQSLRIARLADKFRYSEDSQERHQSAYDLLVIYNDMRQRHPTWIKAMNRFLHDREGIVNADCQAWARKAYKMICDNRKKSYGQVSANRSNIPAYSEIGNEF